MHKNAHRQMFILPIAAVALAIGGSTAAAQAPPPYLIQWGNLEGAGGLATGGTYQLGGTLGQPDAGVHTGGSYKVLGGFWVSVPYGLVDVEPVDPTPRVFVMRAPMPNPFQNSTLIAFELPEPRPVEMTVHSVDGRSVRRLLREERGVGRHGVTWDGRNDAGWIMPSGLYFVRLLAGPYSATQRLVRLD